MKYQETMNQNSQRVTMPVKAVATAACILCCGFYTQIVDEHRFGPSRYQSTAIGFTF